jgi:type VI secretion system protein ImpA
MTDPFLAQLMQPIAADAPCGPDLDLAGDADFINFLARVESILPGSFFEVDPLSGHERPFERGSRDFPSEIVEVKKLLARTRDLRLLVAWAKFAALDRNLNDFVDIVEATAQLVDARWPDVHPREQGDGLDLRLGALQALDEVKHTVLPLQFTPLIRHPRLGAITFRQKLLADGAPAKEDEEFLDAGAIQRAFMEIGIEDLLALHSVFQRLASAVEGIARTTVRELGASRALSLDRLGGLAKQVLSFLDEFLRKRDARVVPASETQEKAADADERRATPLAAAEDLRSAAALLSGVIAYFERSEPSSPALLLLRQARQLVGRNFVDVMRLLAPDHFDRAVFLIGRNHMFDLPLQRLSEHFADTEGESETPDATPAEIADRASALAALQQVEAFYARGEPSSPVPFLCERARKLSSADFLTILREILPGDALKTKE